MNHQNLESTVNGGAKRFIAKKINDWCSDQISEELQSGIPFEDIDVKLRLSNLKPLHAGWVVDFYNFIMLNGGKAAAIYDAICLGIGKSSAMNPYHDINLLVSESNIPVATNLEAVCQLDLFHTREDNDENADDEDAWEPEIQTSKHNTY